MDNHILIIVDKAEHLVARERIAAVVETVVGNLLVRMKKIYLLPEHRLTFGFSLYFLGVERIQQDLE